MQLDRRTFMKSVSAALIASKLGTNLDGKASEQSTKETSDLAGAHKKTPARPNVIVLICDDLGSGDLGCYGSPLRTPNLDLMASRGMRFTHFNTVHPQCSASRSALLTGRYASRTNTAGAYFPKSPTGMSLDEITLADLFKRHEYQTHCIGKWHLGDAPAYLPINRGFDSFFGVPYSNDMQPLPLIRDLRELETDTDRDLLTEKYISEAVRFINEPREKQFFIYLAFSYPHDPARSSPAFRGKSGLGDYGDSVAEIDWGVGEIVRALEQKGIAKDTLACFTSDHGPWFQGSPGNLRGRKGTTFEGGCRVPFLAFWPETVPSGTVNASWATNLDLLPTLSSLCGLGLPTKPLDGVDFSAELLGKTKNKEREKAVLYFNPITSGGADIHCARKDKWKLRVAQADADIYNLDRLSAPPTSHWLPHAELYDLENDPGESYDVAKTHPELVKAMMADLDGQVSSFPPAVTEAYAKLKLNHADISTPPGAIPRPVGPQPAWAWEPEDRRS